MAGIVAILILLGTLLAYALVLRKRDKQNVAREIEILRKLVNESQSPDKLSGYKEIAWKCRIMCTKSQAAEIDALIADINTRQIEWMSLALDEELDGIIDFMQPKPQNTLTRILRSRGHSRPTKMEAQKMQREPILLKS
jgi:hypothetical protein